MRNGKYLSVTIVGAVLGYVVGSRFPVHSSRRKHVEESHDGRECNARIQAVGHVSHTDRASRAPASGQLIPDGTGPLTRQLLRDRISETFSGGYLTLLAIIQGVALAALITSLYDRIFLGNIVKDSGLQDANLALQAAGALAAIVVVTDNYFLFVRLVRWNPTLIDTIAPYALGIGEVGAAYAVGNNVDWWGAVSLTLFAGALAFGYTWVRISEDVFGELKDKLYRPFLRSVFRQCAASLALAVVSLVPFGMSLARAESGVRSESSVFQWFLIIFTVGAILGAVLIELLSLSERNALTNAGIRKWKLGQGIGKRREEWRERRTGISAL
jgi:hypothetical protein